MPTAIDVADWIVRYRADDIGAPVDPMSLEKHIFYCQSFYLALNREELFGDEIEAWRDGPVVPEVYQAYKGFGVNPIIPIDGGSIRLGNDIEKFLQEVVDFFGRYTTIQLSNATHAEEPWQNARLGFRRSDASQRPISKDQLRSYYAMLIADGEEALSRQELLDVVAEPRWGWLYVAGICARMMTRHPFYSLPMAKKLAEPVPLSPELPDEFYHPLTSKDYLQLGDVSGLTVDEIAGRISDAMGRKEGRNPE